MSFTDAQLTATLPQLRRVAKKLTRDDNIVEDLVNDTVVKALRFRDKFQEGGNLPSWMSFIMRNHFVSGTRRNKFKGETYEGAELDLPAVANPEAAIELQQTFQAMTLLSERQRQSITLVALGDSYEEAAAKLGLAVGTVKSAASRGRAILNSHFQ